MKLEGKTLATDRVEPFMSYVYVMFRKRSGCPCVAGIVKRRVCIDVTPNRRLLDCIKASRARFSYLVRFRNNFFLLRMIRTECMAKLRT